LPPNDPEKNLLVPAPTFTPPIAGEQKGSEVASNNIAGCQKPSDTPTVGNCRFWADPPQEQAVEVSASFGTPEFPANIVVPANLIGNIALQQTPPINSLKRPASGQTVPDTPLPACAIGAKMATSEKQIQAAKALN
jgi:hypothetical protein